MTITLHWSPPFHFLFSRSVWSAGLSLSLLQLCAGLLRCWTRPAFVPVSLLGLWCTPSLCFGCSPRHEVRGKNSRNRVPRVLGVGCCCVCFVFRVSSLYPIFSFPSCLLRFHFSLSGVLFLPMVIFFGFCSGCLIRFIWVRLLVCFSA